MVFNRIIIVLVVGFDVAKAAKQGLDVRLQAQLLATWQWDTCNYLMFARNSENCFEHSTLFCLA